MNLEAAGGFSAENATPQDIDKAFEDEAVRGEYVQLMADDGGSIQAADNGDGQFVLQYIDAAGQIGTADEEVSAADAKAALADYLGGGTGWKESRQWIEEAAGGGCLPVVLLALPAFWWAAWAWLH